MKPLLLAIAILLAAGEPSARAASEISCTVFTSGGGVVTGATVTLTVALGQDVVGISTGSTHVLRHDAWPCGPPTTTAVEEDPPTALTLGLGPNLPNPFRATTELYYNLPPGAGRVSLYVFDASGRLVRTLLDGAAEPGHRHVSWDGTGDDGRRVSSGVYYGVLNAGGTRIVHRLVRLR